MTQLPGPAHHFNEVADAYERSRPGYPPEAIEFLARTLPLHPGVRVIDLAAGTGKLSRALLPTGVDLVAVEPLPGMREVYRRAVPRVPIQDGLAQSIPRPASSADVVAIGQAFHWFASAEVLVEIARVLSPTGQLVLVWNKRDQSVGWVRRFSELMEPFRGDTPSYRSDAWKAVFPGSPFDALRHQSFRFIQELSRPAVVDRALSVSFIAGLAPDEQARVASGVLRILDEDPETAGKDPVPFPYETSVYWSRKHTVV